MNIQRHTVSQAEPCIVDVDERAPLIGCGLLGAGAGQDGSVIIFHIDMFLLCRRRVTVVKVAADGLDFGLQFKNAFGEHHGVALLVEMMGVCDQRTGVARSLRVNDDGRSEKNQQGGDLSDS